LPFRLHCNVKATFGECPILKAKRRVPTIDIRSAGQLLVFCPWQGQQLRDPGCQFVLHAKALPGNSYDGHPLRDVIDQTQKLTGLQIQRAWSTRGTAAVTRRMHAAFHLGTKARGSRARTYSIA
jgi:hypothetical protein